MKSLALASAHLGLGFYAILGSRTGYFKEFYFAIVFTETQAV